MVTTDYTLMQASIEIILLVVAAFILGILTCKLFRAMGICCRAKVDEEPSLFALKEPAFDTHTTPFKAYAPIPEPIAPTVVNYQTPTPVAPIPQPVLDLPDMSMPPAKPHAELTAPQAVVNIPELQKTAAPALHNEALVNQEIPAMLREQDATPAANTGYVVDINTLLRRNPEAPPVATLAAAAKHQGYDTQTGRFAQSVSIADLLNTQTDLIDNLRKLEGITPRIEALLNEAGIKNYNTLSKTEPTDLKAILIKSGEQFRHLDPQTWPFQAELAAKGEWTRLQDYQNYLISNKPS